METAEAKEGDGIYFELYRSPSPDCESPFGTLPRLSTWDRLISVCDHNTVSIYLRTGQYKRNLEAI
jgi:hypothetical protein